MNIVLIGMRGSGKSAIGKKIAEILSYNFFDLDAELTTRLNKNIEQVISEEGWGHFREEEAITCESISHEKRAIIATGGGVILNEKNMKNLKENGIIILLTCDIGILKNRLAKDHKNVKNRPALTDKNCESEIEHIWNQRKDLYHSHSNLTYDVSEESENSADDITKKAHEIIELVKKHRK